MSLDIFTLIGVDTVEPNILLPLMLPCASVGYLTTK